MDDPLRARRRVNRAIWGFPRDESVIRVYPCPSVVYPNVRNYSAAFRERRMERRIDTDRHGFEWHGRSAAGPPARKPRNLGIPRDESVIRVYPCPSVVYPNVRNYSAAFRERRIEPRIDTDRHGFEWHGRSAAGPPARKPRNLGIPRDESVIRVNPCPSVVYPNVRNYSAAF